MRAGTTRVPAGRAPWLSAVVTPSAFAERVQGAERTLSWGSRALGPLLCPAPQGAAATGVEAPSPACGEGSASSLFRSSDTRGSDTCLPDFTSWRVPWFLRERAGRIPWQARCMDGEGRSRWRGALPDHCSLFHISRQRRAHHGVPSTWCVISV